MPHWLTSNNHYYKKPTSFVSHHNEVIRNQAAHLFKKKRRKKGTEYVLSNEKEKVSAIYFSVVLTESFLIYYWYKWYKIKSFYIQFISTHVFWFLICQWKTEKEINFKFIWCIKIKSSVWRGKKGKKKISGEIIKCYPSHKSINHKATTQLMMPAQLWSGTRQQSTNHQPTVPRIMRVERKRVKDYLL